MELFWFLIGICNIAYALQHRREGHDFRCGLGCMGALWCATKMFICMVS